MEKEFGPKRFAAKNLSRYLQLFVILIFPSASLKGPALSLGSFGWGIKWLTHADEIQMKGDTCVAQRF